MRSSPFERLWRPKSLRLMAIVLAISFASNMSGCHGGQRNSMRPRFITSTTRSQAVIVDQGYATVETPGAIIQQEQGAIIKQEQGAIVQQEQGAIVQQQQGAIIQQEQGAIIKKEQGTVIQQEQGRETPQPSAPSGGQQKEPPIILEPRKEGATTSSVVVPSTTGTRQTIESIPRDNGTELTPRKEGSRSSVIESLAPPVEAPKAIQEKPPISNLNSTSIPPSNSIESTIKREENGEPREPRLEVVPTDRTRGFNGSVPSNSGEKDAGTAKASAWRTRKPASSPSRITYQASTRKAVESGKPPETLGVID